MSSLPGYMPYDVRETEQFADDWRRAVRLGYLNPMVHPDALLQIKISLALDPYIVLPIPGETVGVRRIRLTESVGLWYGIIEDDRVVDLLAVRIIGVD